MSMLSKFVKKNKKGLLKVGRVILAGVTKGKSEKIISKAESIGHAVKTYKGLSKKATKAEEAALARAAALSPPKVVSISSAATAMPGGSPIRGVARKKAAASVVKKPKKRAAKGTAKAPKRPAKGRKAPTGGKDFKALSKSWNAAGKPGTWLAWVKAH